MQARDAPSDAMGMEQQMMSVDVVSAGVGISFALCVFQSLALVVERRFAERISAGPGGVSAQSSRFFAASLACIVVARVLERVAELALLPLVVVVVVQCSYLVLNPLLAWVVLRTACGGSVVLAGIASATSGAVIGTLGFGKEVALSCTLEQLVELVRTDMQLWLVVTCALLVSAVAVNAVPQYQNKAVKGVLCGVASGVLSGHLLAWLKCVVMVLERALFTDKNLARAVFNWKFSFFVVSGFASAVLYLVTLAHALRFWNPLILKPLVTSVSTFTALIDSLLIFHHRDTVPFLKLLLVATVFCTSIFILSYNEPNQSSMTDEENPLEPNRTTTLSYTSLRPLSMYSTTSLAHDRSIDSRQSIIVDETSGDGNYVSFHRSSDSEGNDQGNNKRRPLSFEQEELLAHLA